MDLLANDSCSNLDVAISSAVLLSTNTSYLSAAAVSTISDHLVSTNSFENTATSLSDDSGLPQSSISISSSNGSSRFGLCKYEFEVITIDCLHFIFICFLYYYF